MIAKLWKPSMLILTVLALLPLIIAAGSTGKIRGTVTDKQTGDPIVGAAVKVLKTGHSTITDQNGDYLIADIPPGKYRLRFASFGYQIAEVPDVEVEAGSTTLQNAEMESTPDLSSLIEEREGDKKADGAFFEAPFMSLNKRSQYAPQATLDACGVSGGYPPAHGGTAIVNGEPFDAMFFKKYGTNPFVDTEDDSLSTFAIDVDDASYIMTRSYIERGHLPPDEAVRTEEFINHFRYNYPSPERGPFSIHFEGAPSRFGKNCQLLKIGIKGTSIAPEKRKDANLVFVIDVSGSMGREDRLGLVRKSLRMLVDNLNGNDRVGIVVYGSRGKVLLEPTSIEKRHDILSAIEWLRPEGSTNADEGLRLGYDMAEKMFEPGRINRIILCSDGVANVGLTSAEDLLKRIKRFAEKGITLTSVGFGMGNYNDILMEKLGNKGNGFYAYVDDFAEAKRIFMENLTGTLQVIARDVKIQVEFDAQTVRSYRLLGYENRNVDDDKFRDDKEDGGEIGSGHQVTALYEVKFFKESRADRLGTMFIRYKDPDNGEVTELSRDITRSDFRGKFESCSADFKLAAAAAEFAEILRKSYWAKGSELSDVYELAKEIFRADDSPEIVEFMNLISKAEKFQDELAEK